MNDERMEISAQDALTPQYPMQPCPSGAPLSFESVLRAYTACRRHKRNTPDAVAFETRWEERLLALWHELAEGRYRIGRSTAFIVDCPVRREVFAASFRDRIVHHWLMERLAPLLEREFVFDSYSCREGKGTLFGVRRVRDFIAECSAGYREDCWVLKCDLRAFFMSVDRERLARRLEGLIQRKYEGADKELVLSLSRQIVMHAPERNCTLRCDPRRWRGLARDKSLFAVNGLPMPSDRAWTRGLEQREQLSAQTELFGRGLPIGNLTSQWLGNLYLTPFDRFVQDGLGVRYYGRYVDDFVIVHRSRAFLRGIVPRMEAFLREELGLTLHPRKRSLQHYAKGVKFLGTVILPGGGLHVGTRTKTGMYGAIRRWNRVAETKGSLDAAELDALRRSVNSYWGLMLPMGSYRLRRHAAGTLAPAIRAQVRFEGFRKMTPVDDDRKRKRETIAGVLRGGVVNYLPEEDTNGKAIESTRDKQTRTINRAKER